MSGTTHIDEVERLLDHDLPGGDYETIAGLVITELQRLPQPGDVVTVELPHPPGAEDDEPRHRLTVTVNTVDRRVPQSVSLALHELQHEAGEVAR